MALEDALSRVPGLAGYLGRQEFDRQQSLGQLQQAASAMQIGTQLKAQQEGEQIKAILAGSPDLATAIPQLAKLGPTGIATATHLAGLEKERTSLADATRQRSVREPGFVRQFMTPGAPAIQPDPQEAAQSADYGTPTVATTPAKAPGFDATGYLQAAAAAGAVDPMALAKEQLAEKQPKFAPGRSPGYFQNGQWVPTPENMQPRPILHEMSVGNNKVQTFQSLDGGKTWAAVPGSQPSDKFNPNANRNPALEALYKDYANHPQVKEANDLEAKMKPLVDYMIDFKKTGKSVNANDAALAKAYLASTTSLGNRAYTVDKRELSALPNLGDRLGNMASSFFAGKDLTDQTRGEMFNYIVQRYKGLDAARTEQRALTTRRAQARGIKPEEVFGATP